MKNHAQFLCSIHNSSRHKPPFKESTIKSLLINRYSYMHKMQFAKWHKSMWKLQHLCEQDPSTQWLKKVRLAKKIMHRLKIDVMDVPLVLNCPTYMKHKAYFLNCQALI